MLALLDITALRHHYVESYAQLKRQSAWVIELARLFKPDDEQGQPRTARQVKREVNQFLARLEQAVTECPTAKQAGGDGVGSTVGGTGGCPARPLLGGTTAD